MLMQKFQQVARGVPARLQLCCATNPAAIPQAAMSHHSSPWHPIFYVATYSNCRQKQEIKVWKFKCKVFDKKLKVRSVVGLKTSRTIFTRFGQTDVKIEHNNNSSAARKIHIYVNIIDHISWAKLDPPHSGGCVRVVGTHHGPSSGLQPVEGVIERRLHALLPGPGSRHHPTTLLHYQDCTFIKDRNGNDHESK